MSDIDDLFAMQIEMLHAKVGIAAERIAMLERFETAMVARINTLETALARASHGIADEQETRPRRIVDDCGRVSVLREGAA